MSATLNNRHRLLEKYSEVVRQDGLNTNQNVNIGIDGATPNLWVAGDFSVGGTITGGSAGTVNVTGSNVTLTSGEFGSVVTLNPSAAVVVTLPTPVAGAQFTFIVGTAATSSNTIKVITGTIASQFLQGYLGVPVAAGTQTLFFGNGTTDVSINLNGTTTGGLIGGEFTLTGISSTIWQVAGNVEGSGTVATPFGTS